ncbi:Zinc finger BED domain-containing protein 4 [Bienertia sinuspersici]
MKKPKNYKWKKNDGTGTISRHLRSEQGLGPEGEGGSSGGGQAQLHGYASNMPGAGMPFVYNRDRMIAEFGKFIIVDELSFSFDESPNYEYFNRVALQPQYRRVPRNTLKRHTPTRWNSTYKLLHDAIAYRDFITNDHWSLAKIVHDVLETFDNATHIFSYVYEPNIHTVILECIKIICTIKQTSLANPGAAVKRLLDNMKVKWCAYFTEFPPIYAIAAILDPGVKLEGLTKLLTFYYQQLDVQFDVPYYVNNFKRILERLCEDYGAVIQPQPVGSSMGASRFGILGPILKKSRPDGSGSSSSSSNIAKINHKHSQQSTIATSGFGWGWVSGFRGGIFGLAGVGFWVRVGRVLGLGGGVLGLGGGFWVFWVRGDGVLGFQGSRGWGSGFGGLVGFWVRVVDSRDGDLDSGWWDSGFGGGSGFSGFEGVGFWVWGVPGLRGWWGSEFRVWVRGGGVLGLRGGVLGWSGVVFWVRGGGFLGSLVDFWVGGGGFLGWWGWDHGGR